MVSAKNSSEHGLQTGAHRQRKKNLETPVFLECHCAKASSTKNVILN